MELAYGGTCTAGKNEDMDMYAEVLADALKQGKRVAASVEFYIQFGSQETRDYCVQKGYLEIFRKAGAHVLEPSCGACINAGPGVSTRPDQVVISAQNRNFPGRSGPGQMYLASPLTVAASAVAGYIVEYQPSENERTGGSVVVRVRWGDKLKAGENWPKRMRSPQIPARMCGFIETRTPFQETDTHGIRDCRTLHRDQGHGLRGRVPGGLHPPEERRPEARDRRDAVYRPGGVH